MYICGGHRSSSGLLIVGTADADLPRHGRQAFGTSSGFCLCQARARAQVLATSGSPLELEQPDHVVRLTQGLHPVIILATLLIAKQSLIFFTSRVCTCIDDDAACRANDTNAAVAPATSIPFLVLHSRAEVIHGGLGASQRLMQSIGYRLPPPLRFSPSSSRNDNHE